MKPVARPVYLNLLRIHLPLTGWVSILHRVSGVLLFAALPLGVWALTVSLSDEAGFRRMADAAAYPLAKFVVVGLVWAFAHHLFGGLRHLALDVHWGTGIRIARLGSLAVILAACLVALVAAWGLYA